MNGCDVLDQLVSSYDHQHRSPIWKNQVYHTGLNVLEVICYQIYKKQVNHSTPGKCPMPHCLFKQSIALELLKRRTTSRNSALLPSLSTDNMMSEASEVHTHGSSVMGKRGDCRYKVANPRLLTDRNAKPKISCGAKITKGCKICSIEFNDTYFLCSVHYEDHLDDVKARELAALAQ